MGTNWLCAILHINLFSNSNLTLPEKELHFFLTFHNDRMAVAWSVQGLLNGGEMALRFDYSVSTWLHRKRMDVIIRTSHVTSCIHLARRERNRAGFGSAGELPEHRSNLLYDLQTLQWLGYTFGTYLLPYLLWKCYYSDKHFILFLRVINKGHIFLKCIYC